MSQIRVLYGKKVKEVVELDVPGLLVGRSMEADLVLDSEVISRHHCQIVEIDEGHVVLDLNSKAGLMVNGNRTERHPLQYGDRIEVAKYTLVYEASPLRASADPDSVAEEVSVNTDVNSPEFWNAGVPTADPDEPSVKGLVELKPAAKPASSLLGTELPDAFSEFKGTMQASASQMIRVRASLAAAQEPHVKVRVDGEYKHLVLGDRPFTVGYFDGAAYRLPGKKWLGKIQFSIERKRDDYYLTVLSFWAKVYLNRKRIGHRVRLKEGSTIECGGVRFRFSSGDKL